MTGVDENQGRACPKAFRRVWSCPVNYHASLDGRSQVCAGSPSLNVPNYAKAPGVQLILSRPRAEIPIDCHRGGNGHCRRGSQADGGREIRVDAYVKTMSEVVPSLPKYAGHEAKCVRILYVVERRLVSPEFRGHPEFPVRTRGQGDRDAVIDGTNQCAPSVQHGVLADQHDRAGGASCHRGCGRHRVRSPGGWLCIRIACTGTWAAVPRRQERRRRIRLEPTPRR